MALYIEKKLKIGLKCPSNEKKRRDIFIDVHLHGISNVCVVKNN